MADMKSLCDEFSTILGGKGKAEKGVCSVEVPRDLDVKVQGKKFKSEVKGEIHFESLDEDGKALNMGELVILQEEVPAFMKKLLEQEVTITALHNHWFYSEPTILYIHFQTVEPPLDFAKKVKGAIDTLG
ncbi:DUF1259 domain-containing protein [Pseudalkalibacillus caeni]|uniref:DUF1259 domain-containing protein n=1 Tax=Exobacillus caeni TaxID=2574798 RepID=A0A5R9FF13_9BACL|nr:DUF1259 domain-containing protein [Pseudalkalibacillus caeni]TLS38165.1 DUF1259 domain-containing protein [Pseudalkalibacillus caeni]